MLVTIDLKEFSSETLKKMTEETSDLKLIRKIKELNNWKLQKARDVFTTLEMLDNLSKDEDVEVRLGVAANPKTSSQTLENLLEDEVAEVREAAKENLRK